MKNLKQLLWMSPLVLLIAGCATPVQQDTTISEWQREGLLPPTGVATSRIYAEPASYPTEEPSIVVESEDKGNTRGDLMVADSIRQQVEYDRGLAPSLEHVTIVVRNGQIILRGSVKSDLDARVIVDSLREIVGVSQILNQLEINPNV